MERERLDLHNGVLRVCVDRLENGTLGGRVLGRRLSAPLCFSDMGDLILHLSRLLDAQNFPQAYQRTRSFAKEKVSYPEPFLPEDAMSAGEVAAAHGERGTCDLYILSRQNATLQGQVDWLDGTKGTFSSDLELLQVMWRRLAPQP